MYLNKVQLYGNLTRDPETRAMPSGQGVTNFNIATNRSYKDKQGQKQEQVEYHTCVAFGKVAEIISQYMKKGKPIYIEGRLQTRSWDKEGAKQYRTEVVVENFQFGPSAPGTSRTEREDRGEDTDGGMNIGQESADDINPDEIPF